MKLTTPAILALFTAVFAPTGAEWCDFDNDWWNTKETYCSDGCCFDSCCDLDLDLDLDLDEIDIHTNYAAIAGGCVGAFIFIVIVLTLICACVKSGTRQGRVITVVSPVGVSTVATTATGGATGYGMYTSNQLPPPPLASNQLPPPPPPAEYKLPLQSVM